MDREEVITALEERIRTCSMVGDGFDVTINWKLADDILALLKENEMCKECPCFIKFTKVCEEEKRKNGQEVKRDD